MLEILKHAHSGFRWIVLILLITTIVTAFSKKKAGNTMKSEDKKLPLFTLIATHIQLILGIILYFISPYVVFAADTMKDSLKRFYTVEHILLMLIAITLITIGYSKGKKAASWKTIFNYYLIGLILILLSIPWPFRGLSAGWF
ncbi:MAG: cytochrome B [Saprospiraceae bacterium]|nr:cytochrome B [Saprospiraceae bacterium]MCB9323489.1 cytochrome B [Lewinellaceae bacterium]